jgi:hypothetical protein
MRVRALPVVAVALSMACAGLAPAAQAAPNPADAGFAGNAFGTYANVANIVVAGATAPIGVGCLTPANQHGANAVAAVTIPKLANIGAVDTTADTFRTPGLVGDTLAADVNGTNLLNGLITATAVRAQSETTDSLAGVQTSAQGTGVVGLVIAGKPIPINVGPNTTIPLPGIGKVVLNEQQTVDVGNTVAFTVNMIHVYVSVGSTAVRAGTQVIVGHATSGLTLGVGTAIIGGGAYSLFANVAGIVHAPPAWGVGLAVGLGCAGNNGKPASNEALGVFVPNVAQTGTFLNTSQGTLDLATDSATGQTTSQIQRVSLLGGLVKAQLIKAESNATIGPFGAAPTFNDDGSRIVGLVVAGKKIPVDVGPNFHISVAGITVWVHRVIQTPTSLEVRMLEVTGTAPKLPPGANLVDLRVAVAATRTP